MKNNELIKSRLSDFTWFRERKNKNFGIAKLLIRLYNLNIDPKTLEEVIVEASSLDRMWRKTLQDNPHLRGSDYESKEILEQNKEIELGYEVDYFNDIKQKKLL